MREAEPPVYVSELSLEKARQVAQEQTTARLPAGVNTPGNYFYHIEREANARREPIGYLWYSINQAEGFAWLEAIDLFDLSRTRGVAARYSP